MISLIGALLLCQGLLVHSEPPATSYSITGDNRYDYTNSVGSGGYLGKEGHTENRDFYTTGSNGHGVIASNQGNSHSLSSSSYSGFSPSSPNTGYASYSSSSQDDYASQYPQNPHTSAFKGYSTTSSNAGDSSFDSYTAGAGHGASNVNHYSSNNQKSPAYVSFADNVAGSSATSYSESLPEPSSFRGYSTVAGSLGYSEGDQGMSDELPYAFGGNSDFPLTKQREGYFGAKHPSDVFASPSEMRYLRGNQGNSFQAPSAMYLMSSASAVMPGLRPGGPGIFGPGKFTKHGSKFPGEYAVHGGPSYSPRDQEADLSSVYGKMPGKVIILKDSRPSAYAGQSSYPSAYLSKLMGVASHKGKLSGFMSYPGGGHSSAGHSYMPGLHSSFGGPYSDGHAPRGYRSSAAYVPGHSSLYPAYH